METEDILHEVPANEIPTLLELLKTDWPKHFLLHQYITIMEHYKTTNAKISQTLYRCGNIEAGFYIVKTSFVTKQHLDMRFFVYTCTEDLAQISEVLKKSTKIPWESEPMILFELTLSRFSPFVAEAAASRGVTLDMEHDYIVMIISPTDEINMRPLPDDVCLKYLDESHVAEIDRNWSHRFPGSDEFLAQQIKMNFGLGLFRRSDNKILSSSINFHSGGIFVLYTDENNRGKGYAEIIVCSMVKEIRQRGIIPFGSILKENILSQKLFSKIGFKYFATIKNMKTISVDNNDSS